LFPTNISEESFIVNDRSLAPNELQLQAVGMISLGSQDPRMSLSPNAVKDVLKITDQIDDIINRSNEGEDKDKM
jgi:hypothetical protein